LGFGECEKPAISYTIYVWDAQVTDFIKEVAVAKQNWKSFVVGGNSIGGFNAASTAANECATVDCKSVCSSGAPGTGRCQGVVLMNPAGPIQSREDVRKIEAAAGGDRSKLLTVAQVSATGALPPCKPPTRPVARVLGNGLLSYLRPRIQSICANLYPSNPAAVDKALCDTIERDSLDPGAINVMISGAKLPPPRSMNEMLKADYGGSSPETLQTSVREVVFDGPVLIATGILDPLNDARGRSEGLLALREGIEFDAINGGHCPHDELPQDVAKSIAKWMTTTVRASNSAASKTATTASTTSTVPR
jgi:pimeloyl-ACP methyl ester carboxylesterase